MHSQHQMEWEPPDLIRGVFRGDLDEAAMRRVLDEVRVFSKDRGYVLGLFDSSQLGSISNEARRMSSEIGKEIPYRGIAVYGASFQVRVIAKLLLSAINLFSKNDNPFTFHKTEAEARAWLEERRRQVHASTAPREER